MPAALTADRGDPPIGKVALQNPERNESPGVVIDLATQNDQDRAALVAGIPELFSDRGPRKGRPMKEASGSGGPVSIGRRPVTIEYVIMQGLEGGQRKEEPSKALWDRMHVSSTQSALVATTSLWKPLWPGT